LLIALTPDDEQALIAFLRDLVQIPSLSGQEGQLAARLAEEMRQVGFHNVWVDRIGNVVGQVNHGSGPLAVYNGHMDTVGIGDQAAWTRTPFGAEIQNGRLYGRGSSDMKASLAAMVYGAKVLLDSGLAGRLGGTLYIVGVVQEEPTEGMAMRVLVEEEGLRPDFVLLGEPTGLQICRGHRGRIELEVTVHGRSCHASAPQRGENAIYAAAKLIFGVELLAPQLLADTTLGQGSVAVTQIESVAGSRNMIPDRCTFILDRRLTIGETESRALYEIQQIISREQVQADVQVTKYETTSYTGYVCRGREFYPAWLLPEDHPLLRAVSRGVETALGFRPQVRTWAFSTDGVYTMGEAGIPTVGFGPGEEQQAHTADESVSLYDVIRAASAYAHIAAEVLKSR